MAIGCNTNFCVFFFGHQSSATDILKGGREGVASKVVNGNFNHFLMTRSTGAISAYVMSFVTNHES